MSNPSRFDTKSLISSVHRFDEECLAPSVNRWQCDIRTSSTKEEGLLPGTKALLLLGDRSLREWSDSSVYDNNSLNEVRGYSIKNPFGIPCVSSYLPQDCIDRQDYEGRLNPILAKEERVDTGGLDTIGKNSGEMEQDSDDDEDEGDVKRHGRTSRGNYFHWLRSDTRKAIFALSNTSAKAQYNYIPYPSSARIVEVLQGWHDNLVYLDIECHPDTRDTFCIGVSCESSPEVYVIPLLRYDYTPAYSDLHKILRALSQAMRRNCIVAHNSMFDLTVLAHKYSLPFGRLVYDTMLCQHRCFPEAEKSLGHSLSAWPEIWESFHKDEGVFPPHTPDQEKALWSYNAKDVVAMKLIRRAQLDYAKDEPGLLASFNQANSMVRPYIISQLQGIRYNEQLATDMRRENDKIMTHHLRALKILAGRELLPTSPQQCRAYFFDYLDYDINKRTDTGLASTGDEAMQKLKLKYPMNACIDFMIAYREKAKESGMLKFTPWMASDKPII